MFRWKNTNILLIIIIVISIALLLWVRFIKMNEHFVESSIIFDKTWPENIDMTGENRGKIPNKIWGFWEGEPSTFVDRCVALWRKYNPDYEINILNKSTYRNFVDDDIEAIPSAKDGLAKYSDYLRLALLHKYGGI